MKLIGAFALAAMVSVGVAAQATQTPKPTDKSVDVEKKIEVKEGTEITVNGCLKRNPGGGFMITDTAGAMQYALVSDDDLAAHVGHQMEVKGVATDKGESKVEIESAVGTSGTIGDQTISSTNKTVREAKGKLGLRYLGVKSITMVAEACK